MTQVKSKSVYQTLSEINVYEYIDLRGGLKYVSWANAWALLRQQYPNANRTIYENEATGLNYFSDGRTCYVKVGVTVNGKGDDEIIDMLPVMDYRNNSITTDKITSMDVNKAIQRSTVKCIAMHGMGISVYTGEDIPEPSPEPIPLETLTAKHKSYKQVVEFLVSQRHEEFEGLMQKVGTRFDIATATEKKLKAAYDEANEEKQA
tara:strand:+ start:1076 stop:1690 length:615 start_codon:yes stop_codon:yes gene_type:complete